MKEKEKHIGKKNMRSIFVENRTADFGKIYFKCRADAWENEREAWKNIRIYFFDSKTGEEAWSWKNSPMMEPVLDEENVYSYRIPDSKFDMVIFHTFILGGYRGQGDDPLLRTGYQTSDLIIPGKAYAKEPFFIQQPVGNDGYWADYATQTKKIMFSAPETYKPKGMIEPNYLPTEYYIRYRRWTEAEYQTVKAARVCDNSLYYADVPIVADEMYIVSENFRSTALEEPCILLSTSYDISADFAPFKWFELLESQNDTGTDDPLITFDTLANIYFVLPEEYKTAIVERRELQTSTPIKVIADLVDPYNHIFRVPVYNSPYEQYENNFKIIYGTHQTYLIEFNPDELFAQEKVYDPLKNQWIEYPNTAGVRYTNIIKRDDQWVPLAPPQKAIDCWKSREEKLIDSFTPTSQNE